MVQVPARQFTLTLLVLATCLALVLGARQAGVLPGVRPLARGQVAPVRPATTASRIAALEVRLGQSPDDRAALGQLGNLYLQAARESGDPRFYPLAELAYRRLLAADGRSLSALVGLGSLALSRHQFRDALDWGERARAVAPDLAATWGLIADAQTELGLYDEALASIQRMVDLRPNLAAYSRVSYARELRGYPVEAIEAMGRAVAAGAPGQEGTAWTRVQLGHLRFNGGDLAGAQAEYEAALREFPDYLHAIAGLGRVAAARGDWAVAIEYYRRATVTVPLPEYLTALGDIFAAVGDQAAAEEAFALVRVQARLQAEGGINNDLEFALFAADRPAPGGDQRATVAQARAALAARPSIYAHDALAWALYRAGEYDEAWREIGLALRLGTRDAMLAFHAGMIAQARGDRQVAQRYLGEALQINPAFSVRFAPVARAALGRE